MVPSPGRERTTSASGCCSKSASSAAASDNEQLEFLGDSILGFLTSEALVQRHPEYREGELSRLKAHLVSATHLYGVARRLDLGSYLELGRSEEMSGGRAKKTLLVDALEALMAAIYLDGGAVPVRDFVAAHVLDAAPCDDLAMDSEVQSSITNFKSALQELAQSRKLPQPRYAIVRGSAFSGTSCATTSTLACDATSANITSYVQGLAPPGTGTVTVTPSWPGTQPNGSAGSCTTTGSVDGCLVKVKVSVNFKFILGLMPTSQMTFNGTSENVVQK